MSELTPNYLRTLSLDPARRRRSQCSLPEPPTLPSPTCCLGGNLGLTNLGLLPDMGSSFTPHPPTPAAQAPGDPSALPA